MIMLHMRSLGLGAAVLGAWMAAGLAVRAEEPVAADGFGIALQGVLPPEAAERVRAFVERHTSIATRLRAVPPVEGATLDELSTALAAERHPEDAALVLLYACETVFPEHTAQHPDLGVGVVNVNALTADDDEVFLRRVERLAIRTVTRIMGAPLVPNPQSALWTYDPGSLEQLDRMGRNLDPPSLVYLQHEARRRGIPLAIDHRPRRPAVPVPQE